MVTKKNIIEAKDFSKREELEVRVGEYGKTADLKPDVEIHGTREEMARLGLSDRTVFWGIRCVITDEPTKATAQADAEKPVRGDIKDFGTNGVVSKPPVNKK